MHSLTLRVLRERGLPTQELRSKSWNDFARAEAPVMDFIFTVCDKAAGEVCPAWPGRPMKAHWGIQDPVRVEGTEIDRLRVFELVARELEARIRLFTALRLDELDRMSLKRRLDQIGHSDVENDK